MLRRNWVRLTKGQRKAIRHRLRRAQSAAERRRLNAVALYDAGQKMEGIAQTLGCSVGSISLDLQRWRAERFAGLAPKPCVVRNNSSAPLSGFSGLVRFCPS